jgi:predicted dehydrogenase
MGLRHARVFAGLGERAELAGLFDARPEAAREAVASHGGRVAASEAEVVASADLVVVATPNALHAGTVAAALAAGRDVLVEKPLAPRANEAFELASLATRAGRQLFVGHSERFNPVVRALARLLREDEVVAFDCSRIGRSARLGTPSPHGDDGALLVFGVHDLDLAAYLTRSQLDVRAAVGARMRPGGGAEDVAHVLFEAGSGAIGHVHVDRTSPVKRRTLAVATKRFVYEGDLLAHRLVRVARDRGAGAWSRRPEPATDIPLPTDEPLRAQALSVLDALDAPDGRVRRADVARGIDGARAVALTERAAELVRAGGSAAEKLSVLARS